MSIMVREKALQGGGLVPVILGEDHEPEQRGWEKCNTVGLPLIRPPMGPAKLGWPHFRGSQIFSHATTV